MAKEYSTEKTFTERRAAIGNLFSILFVPALILLVIVAVITTGRDNQSDVVDRSDGGIGRKGIVVASLGEQNDDAIVQSSSSHIETTVRTKPKAVVKPQTTKSEKKRKVVGAPSVVEVARKLPLPDDKSKSTSSAPSVALKGKPSLGVERGSRAKTAVEFKVGTELIFPAIFYSDNTVPVKIGKSKMPEILRLLEACQGRVVLVGHSDSRGLNEVNMSLGKQRAEGILKILRDSGFKGKAIAATAGSAQPVGSNATAKGRRQNRRVTIQCRKQKVKT